MLTGYATLNNYAILLWITEALYAPLSDDADFAP
jgi:hypothetical protein